MNTKFCNKCMLEKDIQQWSIDRSKRDGLETKCKKCKKEYDKRRHQKNKIYKNQKSAAWRLAHPEYCREWKLINKERLSKELKERKETDILFKIKLNLRARLNIAIRGNYKSGSAIDDLGCSIEELKTWIEQQFSKGMSWDNYGKGEGKWNIDHIIPLSKVDLVNRKQFKKVCHWFNLRPLWSKENLSRGNRI